MRAGVKGKMRGVEVWEVRRNEGRRSRSSEKWWEEKYAK